MCNEYWNNHVGHTVSINHTIINSYWVFIHSLACVYIIHRIICLPSYVLSLVARVDREVVLSTWVRSLWISLPTDLQIFFSPISLSNQISCVSSVVFRRTRLTQSTLASGDIHSLSLPHHHCCHYLFIHSCGVWVCRVLRWINFTNLTRHCFSSTLV